MSRMKFFIKNYLVISIIFTGGGIFAWHDLPSETSWIGIISILIGAVVIPLGSNISWNKKFKK